MDGDDRPIGYILSRRDALKVMGVAGAALLAACTAQSGRVPLAASPLATGNVAVLDCIVRPELTMGPYFIDEQLQRSDVRVEPSDNSVVPGVPLQLQINVLRVAGSACTPIQGARLDLWQCDANGNYSGIAVPGADTTGLKFLRGYQLTDAQGAVKFLTIYPGWYQGRTVHTHFTIRTKAANGGDYQFTSQFFFDDALTDQVQQLPAYSARGPRTTRNPDDGIYNSGGSQLLLNLKGDRTTSFSTVINIGLDLSDARIGAPDANGGPP